MSFEAIDRFGDRCVSIFHRLTLFAIGGATVWAAGSAGTWPSTDAPAHEVPPCGPQGRGAEWRPPPVRRSLKQIAERRNRLEA